MKKYFLFLIIIIGSKVSAQSSWNKVFTGTVAKVPATMYLQKIGNEYNGYYFYDSKQIPIRLTNDGSTSDSVYLAASEYNMNEVFKGVYTLKGLVGKWNKVVDSNPVYQDFSFTESQGNPPYFDLVYTTFSKEYPAGMEKGSNPRFDYFSSSLWPIAATPMPLANFLKTWFNANHGRKNSLEPIGKLFLNEKNTGFAEWEKELKATKASEIKEYPSGFTHSSERRLLVMYQSDRFLSLADFSYEFSGGAHGNYGTSMKTLDLKNLKELKLSDVFTPAGKTKLASLLEQEIRIRFNIAKGKKLHADDGGELLVSKIEPTENFYITGKGVGFNYTPYEIAAYAYGETNVFIPWEKLKGLLQAGFGN